jgi:regulator of extracellular matrix RemA (YlzA/DUF370 family)
LTLKLAVIGLFGKIECPKANGVITILAPERSPEKRFRNVDISLRAQQEIESTAR